MRHEKVSEFSALPSFAPIIVHTSSVSALEAKFDTDTQKLRTDVDKAV